MRCQSGDGFGLVVPSIIIDIRVDNQALQNISRFAIRSKKVKKLGRLPWLALTLQRKASSIIRLGTRSIRWPAELLNCPVC